MRVSWNGGTPKSSTLMGFSLMNQLFLGAPIYGSTHIHLGRPYLLEDLEEETGSSARLLDGLLDASITMSIPDSQKIFQKKDIASIASFNLEVVTSNVNFWMLNYFQHLDPFGHLGSPHTLGLTIFPNPGETQPAPRCGGGTAQSSAEPDASTQGSAHGNLGAWRSEAESPWKISEMDGHERAMGCLKKAIYCRNGNSKATWIEMMSRPKILVVPHFQTNPNGAHWPF